MITIQPDVELSLIVGDCLTNARAALDYIMYRLVTKYFEDPLIDLSKDRDRKLTSFPLFEAPSTDPSSTYMNRFTYLPRRMPKAIDGTTHAIDVIKSVQPYNSDYRSLWVLHELVNTDKHRLLLITRSDVVSATITSFYEGTEFMTAGHTTGVKEIDLVNTLHGLGFDTESDVPSDKVEVKSQPTIHVTLKDLPVPIPGIKGIPVESVLQQIIETVADVLPKFDRFF